MHMWGGGRAAGHTRRQVQTMAAASMPIKPRLSRMRMRNAQPDWSSGSTGTRIGSQALFGGGGGCQLEFKKFLTGNLLLVICNLKKSW